jgi:hypothetical protein
MAGEAVAHTEKERLEGVLLAAADPNETRLGVE